MKVRELKDRLEKIIPMGFGEFEVVMNTVDERGIEMVARVDGFVHKLDPAEVLRLYSDEEGQKICDDW